MSGDALNVALDEVTNPKVYVRAARRRQAPCRAPRSRSPFNYAAGADAERRQPDQGRAAAAAQEDPEFKADRAAVSVVSRRSALPGRCRAAGRPQAGQPGPGDDQGDRRQDRGQSRQVQEVLPRSRRPAIISRASTALLSMLRDPGDQRPLGGGGEASRTMTRRPPGVHAVVQPPLQAREATSSGRSTPRSSRPSTALRDEIATARGSRRPTPAGRRARPGRVLLGHGLLTPRRQADPAAPAGPLNRPPVANATFPGPSAGDPFISSITRPGEAARPSQGEPAMLRRLMTRAAVAAVGRPRDRGPGTRFQWDYPVSATAFRMGRIRMGAARRPAASGARGLGVFAAGAGQYNLLTAQADAINAETAMQWNQYIYLSTLEAGRIGRRSGRPSSTPDQRDGRHHLPPPPRQPDRGHHERQRRPGDAPSRHDHQPGGLPPRGFEGGEAPLPGTPRSARSRSTTPPRRPA